MLALNKSVLKDPLQFIAFNIKYFGTFSDTPVDCLEFIHIATKAVADGPFDGGLN
jgi:hypothetical protein